MLKSLTWLLTLVTMIAGASAANLATTQDRKIVIRGATVMTATESGLIENVAVVAHGQHV